MAVRVKTMLAVQDSDKQDLYPSWTHQALAVPVLRLGRAPVRALLPTSRRLRRTAM